MGIPTNVISITDGQIFLETELLKQKQFVPMVTQEIIISLWAGTRGYLDKVATKEILRFEALWLDHMKSTKADILTKIMVEKAISDEIENGIKAGMDEFLSLNEFEGRSAKVGEVA